jgi:hypothetical protein
MRKRMVKLNDTQKPENKLATTTPSISPETSELNTTIPSDKTKTDPAIQLNKIK